MPTWTSEQVASLAPDASSVTAARGLAGPHQWAGDGHDVRALWGQHRSYQVHGGPDRPALDEIRRVVTIFRELRSGVTADGRTRLKSPTSTLSTAEAISVVTSGLALAAHFGDGRMGAADVAAALIGAVVKEADVRHLRAGGAPADRRADPAPW